MNIKKQIDNFLFHCQYEKNLSAKTLKAYSIDLTQFYTFIVNHISNESLKKETIDQIDKFDLKKFIENLYAQKRKTRTIKRKFAVLKSFFSQLEFEDIISVNPVRKIKINLREEKRLPKTISFSEIKAIFKTLYKLKESASDKNRYSYFEHLRNIAVIELLFATGIRVAELCNLKLSNIDLKQGFIKIIGKGDKERIIHFCEQETTDALKNYYDVFKQKIHDKDYFFINKFNNRLSEQSVRFMINKFAKKLKIKRKITPHMFRHTVATMLHEADVDIRYIQNILGHSSIMTTQIYTHVNQKKQRKIMSSKHPRKKFQFSNPGK